MVEKYMPKRHYTEEFKTGAVRLAESVVNRSHSPARHASSPAGQLDATAAHSRSNVYKWCYASEAGEALSKRDGG